MRDILFSTPGAPVQCKSKFRKWMNFDLADIGLPEVPFLDVIELLRSNERFPEHNHAGVFEISYLVSGRQDWNVAGQTGTMRGNEVLVKRAGEPHGSGEHPNGKGRKYSLRLRFPGKGKPFLALDAREARPLIAALRSLPRRHFRGDARLRSIFEEVVLLLISPGKSPLKKLRVAHLLQQWLLLVVACGQAAEAVEMSAGIRKVCEYMDGRVGESPSLAELARVAGFSLPWFKVKFKQQVGMGPMEYLLRRKVEAAKRLFENTRLNVTDVAFRLGFSSSQYFATVFKRFAQVSPGEWRERSQLRIKN